MIITSNWHYCPVLKKMAPSFVNDASCCSYCQQLEEEPQPEPKPDNTKDK